MKTTNLCDYKDCAICGLRCVILLFLFIFGMGRLLYIPELNSGNICFVIMLSWDFDPTSLKTN